MHTLFRDYASSETKKRLDSIERLDEVEEWDLLSRHYCVSWGLLHGSEAIMTSLENIDRF